jgi:hypothetical protein
MAINPFTPVFNTTTDLVHSNVTYIIANQPVQMTTPLIYIMCIALGLTFLIISAKGQVDSINDLAGILAVPFLLLATIKSYAVDTVTSYGVANQCVNLVSGVCQQTEWVLLENHTIYHYDLLGVVLAICFIISLANIYRLWLDYTRVIEGKQIPHDKVGRWGEPAKPGYDPSDNANRNPKHMLDERDRDP